MTFVCDPFDPVCIPVPEVPGMPAVPIPDAGPVIRFVGAGEHAVWNDVWGWIKGTAAPSVNQLLQSGLAEADSAINAIEGYVGNELKALSGFFNDLADLSGYVYNTLADAVSAGIVTTLDVYYALSGTIDGIYGEVINLEQAIDGYIDPTLRDLLDAVAVMPGNLAGLLEAWSIDNIYNPLLGDITTSIDNVETVVGEAVSGIDARLSQLENVDIPALLTQLAALGAIVSAITTWVDDCGAPMCDTMGPNTNLGKLLKDLAGILALFAGFSLANLTEADLERIASFFSAITAGDAESFVNAFETGGATIGTAGEAIVSDLTGIAGKVLSEIGVP